MYLHSTIHSKVITCSSTLFWISIQPLFAPYKLDNWPKLSSVEMMFV